MDQPKQDIPVALGGAPVFVQTGGSEGELDQWQQVTEEEAQVAYDMTLRNELSGGVCGPGKRGHAIHHSHLRGRHGLRPRLH